MRKNIRRRINQLLLIFFFFLCPFIVKAEGMATTSWKGKEIAYIGETVEVILKVDQVSGTSNNKGLAAFGGYIEYEKEKLELLQYESLAPFQIKFVDPKMAGVGTDYINGPQEIIKFTFRAKELGTTTISYLDSSQPDMLANPVNISGSKKTIRITDPKFPVTLDETEIHMLTGSSKKLTATYNLEGEMSGSWQSTNQETATVDSSGNITALKEGTTTIIYRTANGYSATCSVTVSNYLKGDVNQDKRLTIKDVMEIMYFYTKKKAPTEEQAIIGDMNGDGKLTLKDANIILAIYLKK
ncbi:MAG: hypothetical protein HFG40_03350 [Bacilli bacterium]|nr:hypothetical protein [Bacilli bacterium]